MAVRRKRRLNWTAIKNALRLYSVRLLKSRGAWFIACASNTGINRWVCSCKTSESRDTEYLLRRIKKFAEFDSYE